MFAWSTCNTYTVTHTQSHAFGAAPLSVDPVRPQPKALARALQKLIAEWLKQFRRWPSHGTSLIQEGAVRIQGKQIQEGGIRRKAANKLPRAVQDIHTCSINM